MTTITQPLEVSVLAAPIAAIDRRALSQAWYSALGYGARNAPRPSPAARVPRATAKSAGRRAESSSGATTPSKNVSQPMPQRTRAQQPPPSSDPERARKRTSHLERLAASTVRSQRVKRATMRLGDGQDRVHVVMEHRGAKLHLVAVCRRDVHERVVRALADVCSNLARRGVATHAQVHGDASCT